MEVNVMNRVWTQEQQNAIDARRGTLLVSAAAGSGKTAVLVQRVIERLTDPVHPSDADKLLVVTFTKAAAVEMRERIAAELSRLLSENPFNRRLQRQQLLLAHAQISTIHSFCSEIVRQNFYKLNISPDFRIVDDSELTLLKSKAIAQVMEWNYEHQDKAFSDLIEAFTSDRDDNRMIQMIEDLYMFTRSHPFPEKWLKETAAMYFDVQNVASTVWGETLLRYAKEAIDYCISLITHALMLMRGDTKILEAYEGTFQGDLAELCKLKETVESGTWDEISDKVIHVSFARLPTLRGYKEDTLKMQISNCREQAKETIYKKLSKLFCVTEKETKEDLSHLSPIVQKLIDITNQFAEVLQGLKAERNAADFGDLEHWTLKLLVKNTKDGFVRTQEAERLSEQFDEVMVDEYQDTNQTQDMLFRAVSQNERNLFMVGDVKQSIYSFRQAMPKIFLERKQSFQEYRRELDIYPAYLVLDKNFRSRNTVTDTINFVFSQIMSSHVGDVTYKGKEWLVSGAQYPAHEGCQTMLDLIDLGAVQEETEENISTVESIHIANTIHKMMNEGFLITENGKQRPVRYGDFCILLRSANRHASDYARELEKQGIPAWTDTKNGFFSTVEIAVILSLLRVIDNPLQDIALAAVLMSPIYGLTVDDMALVRESNRKQSLYLACQKFSNHHMQVAAFLNDLEQYRTMAATMPADRLLQVIYQKSGYLHMVQTMRYGQGRLANLQMLIEYAKQFEQAGYHGLSGFIRYIDRLQKQDADLPSASVIAETADAVKIMSIHRSKGLEFPICILARCGQQFNREQSDALLHPYLGLGVKLRDFQTYCRYTTLPREAIALEINREKISEEMRILYVAMTRAKEKLIMVAALKNLDKRLEKAVSQLSIDGKQKPFVVGRASSFADWLISCALCHPDGYKLRERIMANNIMIQYSSEQQWNINVVLPSKVEDIQEEREQEEEIIPLDEDLLKRLQQQLDFQYPQILLTKLPAKVTASGLAEQNLQETIALSRPRFMSGFGLTPAERGIALHQFMQFADYKLAESNAKAECERMMMQGFLTPKQAQAVDVKKVERFFTSDLGKRMNQANWLKREKRFMIEMPLSKIEVSLPQSLQEETVILQGAVDCVFEEEGQLIIVDFKTDRVFDVSKLWDRYRTQLELYAFAMEQTFIKPVKECLLYSFDYNQAVTGEWRKFILDK